MKSYAARADTPRTSQGFYFNPRAGGEVRTFGLYIKPKKQCPLDSQKMFLEERSKDTRYHFSKKTLLSKQDYTILWYKILLLGCEMTKCSK